MYQPPLGADVTVILGVGAAVLCLGLSLWPGKRHGLSALHRGALLILRLVALAVFVWLLAGPRRYAGQQIIEIRPQLTILADLSESMAQRDVLLDSDRDEKTESKLSSRWEVAVSHWLDSQTLQPCWQ